jgi:hypothetical protein
VEWCRVAELARPLAATSQLTDVLTSKVRNYQSTFAGITQQHTTIAELTH